MAKGSNNIRGRSSDASKPYDVSNSFVKRMASRVTELLPQPSSWFSRWISPSEIPSASDFVGHSLTSTIPPRPPATSRAELNLVDNVDHHASAVRKPRTSRYNSPVNSRPPATSREELNLVDNVDHHAPAAKKPRTNRYNSPVNQKFLRNDGYNAEDISPIAVRGGEPVAGPSSRDPHSELIASTPAVSGQQTAMQMTAKVNGDDCSETSESTSGCSSLVPQAQSSTRSLGGSRYGRSIPCNTSLDALDRRRPSFNTTTFNSPLRASMRARLGSSPFYCGRTMYGGSSQACDYARLAETSQSRQMSFVRRVGPTVRPPPPQQSSLPLSSTAKRILDALEQFSTPMIDAKKMPVVGTKRKLDSTLPGSQQRYAELSIPSTPDLLRVKRRERLQQSTLEARQTAAQSTPTPSPTPASTPIAAEYTIRNEETGRKKHTGKVKTKEKLEEEETVVEVKLPAAVLAVENLPKIDIAIPPPPPALAVSRQPQAPTPMSDSKFVFSQPTIVTSVVTPVSVPTSTFKFSEPLGSSSSVSVLESNKQTSSSATRTSTDQVTANLIRQTNEDKIINFCIINNQTVSESVSAQKTSEETSMVKSINASKDCKYHKGSVSLEDKSVSTTQKWECFKCKNNNSSSLEVCISCQASKNPKPLDAIRNNVKPSVKSDFGNLFKKPAGTWECSECYVQNKGEATRCCACETLKSAPKEKTVKIDRISIEKPVAITQSSSETKRPESGFGEMFKKPPGSWACDMCLVNNNADKVECAACGTPKPGATVPKTTESSKTSSAIKRPEKGFGEMFKKPPGSWICDVCMVNNNADKVECAACNSPKPGASVPTDTVSSTPKFSFGMPSVPTSSSGVGVTFSFGIPKGDKTTSTSDTSSEPKSIISSDNVQTPTQTFSFGIPKPITTESNSSNAVTSSTSSKPTFQFGSGSAQISAQEPNLPFTGTPTTTTTTLAISTPSNIFGNSVKKSTPEPSKPAESEKLAFSATPSTQSASPVFSVSNEKPSTPTLFAFGSNKVTLSESKKSSDTSSTSKPAQSAFMFSGKQEGYGSGIPSSTTNTLSSSSPSNVLKFGETKTVSSGSGAASISSVSTQASVMTPIPNNVFNFGSSSEKKTITFGAISGKETSATSTSTPGTENKLTFGSTTNSTPSTFGSANAFGGNTFGNKEQLSQFAPQTTTNVFGATTTNTSTSTFSTFGQTNSFQPPQQENKPSPVFAFGASAPQKESASGGFVFNPVMFQSNQTRQDAGQLFGFNNTPTTSPAPSTTFNFEPKIFRPTTPGVSPFNASVSAPTPVFGAPTPQQAPAFGEQTTPAPVFNFGSQSAQQPQNPANPVFEFGSNQQSVATAPAPTPTFMFGATPAGPALANPPAFDPNIKPTFNFTQGAATPVFSAIPTVNSAAPAQPQNRKMRKAVRRMNISSVRN